MGKKCKKFHFLIFEYLYENKILLLKYFPWNNESVWLMQQKVFSFSTFFYLLLIVWINSIKLFSTSIPLNDSSEHFLKIHSKTPILEPVFNKVVGFIKLISKRLRCNCFPMNLPTIFRIVFKINTSMTLYVLNKKNGLI